MYGIDLCLSLAFTVVGLSWAYGILRVFFFQEGKIRGKLAKLLKDKDGVRFVDSLATGDGIKIVSILCHSYPSLFSDMELNGLALHHTSSF